MAPTRKRPFGAFSRGRLRKQTALLPEENRKAQSCRSATDEPGSRTLSRFGVESEQIYLVIRDRFSLAAQFLEAYFVRVF